jgi:hypothetical protein
MSTNPKGKLKMKILAISGKKQSGKSTAANFMVSMVMSDTKICEKVYVDNNGHILVSDLLGNKNYAGVFDPCNRTLLNDSIISDVFHRLDPIIRIYNFADILKTDICINILGLTYDQCYGSDQQKNSITNIEINGQKSSAREVMQYVGTDVFRNMKKDVWVSSTINKIIKNQSRLSIISDCRFPNEVSSIKNIGGKVLRLSRSPYKSDHISENILDEDKYDWSNFDYIAYNSDQSLQDYLNSISLIATEIFK